MLTDYDRWIDWETILVWVSSDSLKISVAAIEKTWKCDENQFEMWWKLISIFSHIRQIGPNECKENNYETRKQSVGQFISHLVLCCAELCAKRHFSLFCLTICDLQINTSSRQTISIQCLTDLYITCMYIYISFSSFEKMNTNRVELTELARMVRWFFLSFVCLSTFSVSPQLQLLFFFPLSFTQSHLLYLN